MILTPHILSGAAVASQISNPFAMMIAAMAVHHILDMIPHWDYEIHSSRRRAAQKIALDIAIAGIITLLFIWNLPLEKQFHILLGGFFGVLPDGFLFLYYASGEKIFRRYIKFHHFWHRLITKKEGSLSFIRVLPQIAVAIISIYLLR